MAKKGEGRLWLFRFKWHGRDRRLGLGSYRSVSMAEARVKAREARRLLNGGVNPIDARRGEDAERRAAETLRRATEAQLPAGVVEVYQRADLFDKRRSLVE